MNCRGFEHHVAEWRAGRLSPGRARQMADHRQSCPTCDRSAKAEERFRDDWRACAAAPTPDFWPRLALRLDDTQGLLSRPRTATRRGRAWGGTLILAGITVGGMLLWPASTEPAQRGRAVQEHTARAVSSLPDVSQVDPGIDDPAGTSMENVWTEIDTAAPRPATR